LIHHTSNKSGSFTIYADDFVKSKKLSLEAKATMRYLLSRPDNWKTYKISLAKALGVGRRTVNRVVDELTGSGYLKKCGDSYAVLEALKLKYTKPGIYRCDNEERAKGFSSTYNAPFLNPKISLRARGLLCYLMSLHKDWEVYPRALGKALKLKERTVGQLLTELRNNGYVEKTAKRNAAGQCRGWAYDVYDEPQHDVHKPKYGSSGVFKKGSTADRSTADVPLIITNPKTKTEERKYERISPKYAECTAEELDSCTQQELRQRFMFFAKKYPLARQGSLDDAFTVYMTQVADSNCEVPTPEQLASSLEYFVVSDQWQEDKGRYIPMLESWIRKRRWLEVIDMQPPVAIDNSVASPEESYKQGAEKVRRAARMWREHNNGLQPSHGDMISIILNTHGVEGWVRLALCAADDRIASVLGSRVPDYLSEHPRLESYLRQHHPYVLSNTEKYWEEKGVSNESTGV